MNILQKVVDCIHLHTICDKADVVEIATLQDELLMDDLDIAMVALALEDEFDVRVDSNELLKMRTVKEIVDYVNRKVNPSNLNGGEGNGR
jgi:acyl carrier protein